MSSNIETTLVERFPDEIQLTAIKCPNCGYYERNISIDVNDDSAEYECSKCKKNIFVEFDLIASIIEKKLFNRTLKATDIKFSDADVEYELVKVDTRKRIVHLFSRNNHIDWWVPTICGQYIVATSNRAVHKKMFNKVNCKSCLKIINKNLRRKTNK